MVPQLQQVVMLQPAQHFDQPWWTSTTAYPCPPQPVRGFVLPSSPCPLCRLGSQEAAVPIACFFCASFSCLFLRRCGLNEIIGISLCRSCSPSQKEKRKGWMCFLSSSAISKQQSFGALCLDKEEIHILLLKKILQESNTASALSSNYLLPVPASFNAFVCLKAKVSPWNHLSPFIKINYWWVWQGKKTN